MNGDERALDNLFVEFGPLFYNMAKRYLFDEKYAEDLLSDVFLDLLKSGAKSFNENKNGLNWFFVIIKNKAYKYNCKYCYSALTSEELADHRALEHFIYISEDYDKSLDNIIILDAIKKLDKYENLLLYYSYWENLTIREIAQKLDNLNQQYIKRLRIF